MEQDVSVYITVLLDSLKDKWEVLEEILEVTKRQEALLAEDELSADAFEATLDEKEQLIARMQELDNGFQNLYDRIGTTLQDEAQLYKSQILEMQNYIRVITDCSVKIQALEHSNKEKFASFASRKRKDIREFKANNKTAVSYYQNMANQHHEWQTYFVDKKN